ncbi:hypothetical protein N7474_002439 [Penicillium riverlandense]|uniref:uncharacterized protein n=1 Tax=Penicillium riverlandense TaxID=1903569 RepID=UPI002548414E|nr:uncharacterized protein N7474_002439 [Penicillium riverlandense]KAJ5825301.1 hypothetical protein N7474_002439 [Penicillium riverlandense]
MAKGKKEPKNVNSHIKARLAYLQQAAAHFQASASQEAGSRRVDGTDSTPAPRDSHPMTNLSRVYLSQMRGVSLKTQTRLPIEVKRSFCKRCDTLLVPGVNCSHEVQNASRGGNKPWADVRVVRCLVCKTEKRFPQTDKRGKKLVERRKEAMPPVEVDKPISLT